MGPATMLVTAETLICVHTPKTGGNIIIDPAWQTMSCAKRTLQLGPAPHWSPLGGLQLQAAQSACSALVSRPPTTGWPVHAAPQPGGIPFPVKRYPGPDQPEGTGGAQA
jgi:hypothetical protein